MKRPWYLQEEEEKPTADLTADDLFTPVDRKAQSGSFYQAQPEEEEPVSSTISSFADALAASRAQQNMYEEPVAEEAAAEPEEEEIPEPVVPSANQAILWALQHGGSFETAQKAVAEETAEAVETVEEKAEEAVSYSPFADVKIFTPEPAEEPEQE